MLFDHAGTGMPQVLGHDEQRRAIHDGKRRPSVPENVKADCWLDAGRFAGRLHRADLPGLPPCCAVVPREQEAIGALAHCKAAKESRSFLTQHNVTGRAGLAHADRQCSAVGVEIRHHDPGEF